MGEVTSTCFSSSTYLNYTKKKMSFACKHSSIEIQTQGVLKNRLPNNVMNYNRFEV